MELKNRSRHYILGLHRRRHASVARPEIRVIMVLLFAQNLLCIFFSYNRWPLWLVHCICESRFWICAARRRLCTLASLVDHSGHQISHSAGLSRLSFSSSRSFLIPLLCRNGLALPAHLVFYATHSLGHWSCAWRSTNWRKWNMAQKLWATCGSPNNVYKYLGLTESYNCCTLITRFIFRFHVIASLN